MTKPDAAGAKSLEEILASIRKSLAEQTAGQPNPPAPAVAAKPTAPTQGAHGSSAASVSDAASLLSGKLAGALQASPANGPAFDDDLERLLAPETGKAAIAPEQPGGPAPGPAASEAGGDPWWVLTQPPQSAPAGEGKANGAAHARSEPAAEEEVKLSRPEVLRASLPPLFVAETRETSAALSAAASALPAGEASGAQAKAPGPNPRSSPTEDGAGRRVGLGPHLSGAPHPAPGIGQEAAAATGHAATAVRPGAPSPGALERTIAELLEPVIRNWLDTNLPRLVEKVVREEVVKAIAAERGAPKV